MVGALAEVLVGQALALAQALVTVEVFMAQDLASSTVNNRIRDESDIMVSYDKIKLPLVN